MGILFIIAFVALCLYLGNEEENREAENICDTYQIANKCDRTTAIAKIKVDAMNCNNKHLHDAARRLK